MSLFQIPKVQTFESQSQHIWHYGLVKFVVPDTKGTNFWEPITTHINIRIRSWLLFQIPKVQTFESQSQPVGLSPVTFLCCSRYQRYKLLRANHNRNHYWHQNVIVVPDTKGTNFWEPITTQGKHLLTARWLFQIPKVQTFESQSQPDDQLKFFRRVVPDTKGTNFWEPITTDFETREINGKLFQIPKVQTFESQSQHFRHRLFWRRKLFQIPKVQTFESQSQRFWLYLYDEISCSRYQRYKLLRANHNSSR